MMVAAARAQADGPVRWRYPNTEIEIVEITEGEKQGQFLFSAATVAARPATPPPTIRISQYAFML